VTGFSWIFIICDMHHCTAIDNNSSLDLFWIVKNHLFMFSTFWWWFYLTMRIATQSLGLPISSHFSHLSPLPTWHVTCKDMQSAEITPTCCAPFTIAQYCAPTPDSMSTFGREHHLFAQLRSLRIELAHLTAHSCPLKLMQCDHWR
jgi:hypothetical protein